MKICKAETADIKVRTEPTIYVFHCYTQIHPRQKLPHKTWKSEGRQGPK